MPIDYKKYCKDWKLRSKFIRFYRSKGLCEVCGLPNYSYVNSKTREICLQDEDEAIRIILTVAHLDHDIKNNSFFNLKSMCQKCHLNYDKEHHAETRRNNQINKAQIILEFPETEH